MSSYSRETARNRKKRRRRRRRNQVNYKPIILIAVLLLIMIAVVVLVRSCGNHDVGTIDLQKNASAIYIKDSGEIVYGISESFDENVFDEKELEEQIEKEIDQFNQVEASEEDAMSLDTFSVGDGVAEAVFDFATEQDFVSYMTLYNRANDFVKQEDEQKIYEFYMNNVAEYDGDGERVVVSLKNKEKVSLAGTNGTLLIVTGKYDIQVDGEITYISENCKVNEDGIVETSEEGQSFIVFNL